MKIAAIILTFNEEQHLERCIASINDVVDDIVVVDCYSTDATVMVARKLGARVIQNRWVNYATQFNWALTQLDQDTDWVLRIDADEYVTPEFANEIREKLPGIDEQIDGINCNRNMIFQGRRIRFGGVFPIRVLRLFRYGRGRCENRWMDEHIKVKGHTVNFSGEIVDHNLNSLSWWVDKHNRYASREAIDLLNLKYLFMELDSVASLGRGHQAGRKRWFKETVYARIPGGFRALVYFIYRYVIRLGFLDGKEGTSYHFLHGFWYRYLVDTKIAEVKRYMDTEEADIIEAIQKVLAIDLALVATDD